MGTQTAIAQQIQDSGADYILTLKANHPTLAKDARGWFEQHQDETDDTAVKITEFTCEAGHHRIEKRRFFAVSADQVFDHKRIKQWVGLKTLIVEQSSRQLWNKTTHSTRFFLSSLKPDFTDFPNSIRSHWGVENQCSAYAQIVVRRLVRLTPHAWCLDVVFSEDDSRIRKDHAPRNMTVLKRLALNLLRHDNSQGSLKMKRYRAGLNNNFLLHILSNSGIF